MNTSENQTISHEECDRCNGSGQIVREVAGRTGYDECPDCDNIPEYALPNDIPDDPEGRLEEIERDATGDAEDVTQHATVYQLQDGTAERPRDLRHDPEGTTLSVGDLVEYYRIAGEEDVVDLVDLWERWNRGSGRESRAFIEAETRSLSVGDVVVLDGDAYRCERIGWTEIKLREADCTPA